MNGKKVVKDMSTRKYDYIYYNNSGWLINSIFYTGALKGNPDCEQHFIEHGVSDNKDRIADAAERLTVSYSAAKRYADSHGVKIFNATRGGCLELFTRVDLDAVISTNHKNKIAD